MTQIYIKELTFYSQTDEKNLFSWLESVPEVFDMKGIGDTIIIETQDQLSDDSLREIIAIFYRYGIDMKQLSGFQSEKNKQWFCRKEMYWYGQIFG